MENSLIIVTMLIHMNYLWIKWNWNCVIYLFASRSNLHTCMKTCDIFHFFFKGFPCIFMYQEWINKWNLSLSLSVGNREKNRKWFFEFFAFILFFNNFCCIFLCKITTAILCGIRLYKINLEVCQTPQLHAPY